jgi:hypothetical protein
MVKSVHFRVGNGDMTLIELESGRRILIDINIRAAADDPDDETPDVGTQLRDRLKRDEADRLYVDAFLLTHPDEDHIRGLKNHFHLGEPSTWSASSDKIIIREMWSSPIVFRRASKNHLLCEDAKAWAAEARRRVKLYRDSGTLGGNGDRIKILGEDVDGKTDDLDIILVKTDETFSTICSTWDASFEAHLLAPLIADDELEEEVITKNNSSVVVRIDLRVNGQKRSSYLIGGDADVAVWEKICERSEGNLDWLQYDVLIAPHHCSWRTLSYDSWSDLREKAKVSILARRALAQAKPGALIIASSKAIADDNKDPPSVRAKREYDAIVKEAKGEFRCLADGTGADPLEIEVLAVGPKVKRVAFAATLAVGTGIGSQPFAHGALEH